MTTYDPHIHSPIIVVGAGPVGLFQALALHLRGLNCVVIEKDIRLFPILVHLEYTLLAWIC